MIVKPGQFKSDEKEVDSDEDSLYEFDESDYVTLPSPSPPTPSPTPPSSTPPSTPRLIVSLPTSLVQSQPSPTPPSTPRLIVSSPTSLVPSPPSVCSPSPSPSLSPPRLVVSTPSPKARPVLSPAPPAPMHRGRTIVKRSPMLNGQPFLHSEVKKGKVEDWTRTKEWFI